MDVSLRLEKEEDYYNVENVTRDAFWEMRGRPSGCDEHYLVNIIRKSSDFIRELNYVALLENEIVGHIIYTKSKIIDNENNEYETITFGPVSVLPELQNRGIGSQLIKFSLKRAGELGYRALIIYGHPKYYPRFGFKDARDYKITTPEGENFDAFMAYEIYEGALKGINGKAYLSPVFSYINAEEVRKFDKKFPPKEKYSEFELFYNSNLHLWHSLHIGH